MPYPAHALLQFGGPRGSQLNEMWTCGIRMVPVGGTLLPDALQDYLEDVCVPALQGWMVRAASEIHNTAKLNFAKLNRIDPDGHYVDSTTVETFFANVPGGGAAPYPAAGVAQCALVLTWETDTVSRGLASRGRIYSPAPNVTPATSTGLFDAGTALAIAGSAATLISDLRGTGEAGSMTPNIVSNGGAGVQHRIDSVSVDNKVDIMRKRAASIQAARSRVPVPA